jgi:serine phosphatase RsbU (regulator of sigma subunit)
MALIDLGKLDEANWQLNKALIIEQEYEESAIDDTYAILGRLKTVENKIDSAFYFLNKSLELGESQKDKKSLIEIYNNFSLLYSKIKDVNNATKYAYLMLNLSKETNNFEREIEAYKLLSLIYRDNNDYKLAFEFLELYHDSKSKLGLDETRTHVLKSEFDLMSEQRLLKDSLKFESYNLVKNNQVKSKEKEIKQQKQLLTVLYIGLGIVILAIFGFIRSIRIKKRDNRIILKQKVEVDEQKYLLETQNKKLLTKASLYKILRNCSLDKSVNHVIKVVLEELVKTEIIGNVNKGTVFYIDNNEIIVIASEGYNDTELSEIKSLRLHECICGKVYNEYKINFCESNGVSNEHFYIPILSNNQLQAILILNSNIDLKEKDVIIDFLNSASILLGDTIYRHKISDKLRMANIENTIKKKEIQIANKEINFALENQESINQLMSSIIKNENVGENVYNYASKIFNGMFIKRLNITLFDFEKEEVKFYFLRQNGVEKLTGKPFSLSEFSSETLTKLKRNQRVIVESILDREIKSESDLLMLKENINAFVSFPLMMDKILLGSLNISFENKIDLSSREDEAMAMLVEGVTIAIHQNLLFNEITGQHDKLASLNNEISSSINYAEKIQKSILPTDEVIGNIFPESFFLLKQKDVVGGDSYWVRSHEDGCKIVAAVDCTGHGIPGAFMTMLARVLLREATSVLGYRDPAEILSHMDNAIRTILKQDDYSSMQDGMDMSICVINEENNIIDFAQAQRPVGILFKGKEEIELVKGDIFAVGGFSDIEKKFKTHSFKFNNVQQLYMFSDGYTDQFGGENVKKYGTNQFVRTLNTISKMPLNTQKDFLLNEIENWRGELDQIDDVLVLGIKLN